VQLAGRPFAEALLLQAALAVERALASQLPRPVARPDKAWGDT
jgi:hypothetical protein